MNDETKPVTDDEREATKRVIAWAKASWAWSMLPVQHMENAPEWEVMAHARKAIRHRDFAIAFKVLENAAASDVLTPERKAAIGRAERAIRGALEPSESPMRTMVYLTSITDADLATLREMAS